MARKPDEPPAAQQALMQGRTPRNWRCAFHGSGKCQPALSQWPGRQSPRQRQDDGTNRRAVAGAASPTPGNASSRNKGNGVGCSGGRAEWGLAGAGLVTKSTRGDRSTQRLQTHPLCEPTLLRPFKNLSHTIRIDHVHTSHRRSFCRQRDMNRGWRLRHGPWIERARKSSGQGIFAAR